MCRVRPELDYPAGNRNGTRILVPVNRTRNGFKEFRLRLIRTGYDVRNSGTYWKINSGKFRPTSGEIQFPVPVNLEPEQGNSHKSIKEQIN